MKLTPQKLIVVILLLLIVGAFAFALMRPEPEPKPSTVEQNTPTAPSPTPVPEQTTPPSPAPAAGAYVDYSDTVIASTPGQKVLFFHAPWCPQCRAIEADIKRNTIPAGVTIIKVDYDSRQDLRAKYGVTLQTTFVKVDDSGNRIKNYVAYEEPTFESVKRNIL